MRKRQGIHLEPFVKFHASRPKAEEKNRQLRCEGLMMTRFVEKSKKTRATEGVRISAVPVIINRLWVSGRLRNS